VVAEFLAQAQQHPSPFGSLEFGPQLEQAAKTIGQAVPACGCLSNVVVPKWEAPGCFTPTSSYDNTCGDRLGDGIFTNQAIPVSELCGTRFQGGACLVHALGIVAGQQKGVGDESTGTCQRCLGVNPLSHPKLNSSPRNIQPTKVLKSKPGKDGFPTLQTNTGFCSIDWLQKNIGLKQIPSNKAFSSCGVQVSQVCGSLNPAYNWILGANGASSLPGKAGLFINHISAYQWDSNTKQFRVQPQSSFDFTDAPVNMYKPGGNTNFMPLSGGAYNWHHGYYPFATDDTPVNGITPPGMMFVFSAAGYDFTKTTEMPDSKQPIDNMFAWYIQSQNTLQIGPIIQQKCDTQSPPRLGGYWDDVQNKWLNNKNGNGNCWGMGEIDVIEGQTYTYDPAAPKCYRGSSSNAFNRNGPGMCLASLTSNQTSSGYCHGPIMNMFTSDPAKLDGAGKVIGDEATATNLAEILFIVVMDSHGVSIYRCSTVTDTTDPAYVGDCFADKGKAGSSYFTWQTSPPDTVDFINHFTKPADVSSGVARKSWLYQGDNLDGSVWTQLDDITRGAKTAQTIVWNGSTDDTAPLCHWGTSPGPSIC